MPPKSSDPTIPQRQSARVSRKPTPPTTVAPLLPPSLPPPSLPAPTTKQDPKLRQLKPGHLELLARSISTLPSSSSSPQRPSNPSSSLPPPPRPPSALPPPVVLTTPSTPPVPLLELPNPQPLPPPSPRKTPSKGPTLTDKLAQARQQLIEAGQRLLDSEDASRSEIARLRRELAEEKLLREHAQHQLELGDKRMKLFESLSSLRERQAASASQGWAEAEYQLVYEKARGTLELEKEKETHRKQLETIREGERERMDSWKVARGWKEISWPEGKRSVEEQQRPDYQNNNNINITELELAERHSISTNVVLFGVESKPSSSPEQLLALVLSSLPSSLNAPSPTLVKRKSKAPISSPLILTFADHADRANYLLALTSIPNNPLSARHDLTRAQQLHRRLLVSDAEELKKRGIAAVVRGDRIIVRGEEL